MPRDAHVTREQLIAAGERLFAERGVYQVTVREINEAARQRNTSAIHYHFGSREGLLEAILLRPQADLDEHRGKLLAQLRADGLDGDLHTIVMALLVPLSTYLHTPSGRDYLRIVAQLIDRFPHWRDDRELNPPHMRSLLQLAEKQIPQSVPRAVRRERIVNAIILMMSPIANRARQIEAGERLALDEPTFLDNLAAMIVGALAAPEVRVPVDA